MKIRKHTTSEKIRGFHPKGYYSNTVKNIPNNPLYDLFLASNQVKLQPGLLKAKMLPGQKEQKILDRGQLQLKRGSSLPRNKIHNFQSILEKPKIVLQFLKGDSNNPRTSAEKFGAESQMWANEDTQKIKPLSSVDEILEQSRTRFQKKKQKPRRISTSKNCRKLIKPKEKIPLKLENFLPRPNFEIDILFDKRMKDITAQTVSVMVGNKRIYSYRGDQIKQIASVTKIMTCIVSLYLAQKYSINIFKETLKVSRRAASMEGTSACIKYGDLLTINQLLYGLILPSGNDAATALAQYFHKVMSEKKRKKEDTDLEAPFHDQVNKKKSQTISSQNSNIIGSHLFMREMNRFAAFIGLKNTHFNNPHGLSDRFNVSTANDVAELSYYCMQNQQFRKIVKAEYFQTNIQNEQTKNKRFCRWQNTNKLLGCSDCIGLKTGTTPAAGPTMSAYFHNQNIDVIAVVLNTKTKPCRFEDTSKLYEWAKSVSK